MTVDARLDASCWEVMMGSPSSPTWKCFDSETNDVIEQHLMKLLSKSTAQHVIPLTTANTPTQVDGTALYAIDLSLFVQINVKTGFLRAIRRRVYPSKVPVRIRVKKYMAVLDNGRKFHYDTELNVALSFSPTDAAWLAFGRHFSSAAARSPASFVAFLSKGLVKDLHLGIDYKLIVCGEETVDIAPFAKKETLHNYGMSSWTKAALKGADVIDLDTPDAHVTGVAVVPSTMLLQTTTTAAHTSETVQPTAPPMMLSHLHTSLEESSDLSSGIDSSSNLHGVDASVVGVSKGPVTSTSSSSSSSIPHDAGQDDHLDAFDTLEVTPLPRPSASSAKTGKSGPLHLLQAAGVPFDKVLEKVDDTCCVCLCDLFDEEGDNDDDDEKEEGEGGHGDDAVVVKIPCRHMYHAGCLAPCLKAAALQCPQCTLRFGSTPMGDMPDGWMRIEVDRSIQLAGYAGSGTIVISYEMPRGIQESHHPFPGKRYGSAYRVALLPNTREGRKVLKLLKKAFQYRHTFTVGYSVTRGPSAGVFVVWAGIHHKTSRSGTFGYPDDTYLQRVQDELKGFGITLD